MLVFEKDVYPAFTAGDISKIHSALELVINQVNQSTVDADSVFRLMNWSWPALSSKARVTSPDGVKVVELFTTLVTALLSNCSSALVPAIASCKLVLRSVVRGINAISPEIAVAYLDAVEAYVLPQKAARGFFLDKAAVDNLIGLTSDDAELQDRCTDLIEKILKAKRLFQTDQTAEYLTRIVKTRGCDAEAASLCARVISAHNSRQLYDSLMESMTFAQIGGDQSILSKLTVLNFFIQLINASCPGDRLPASIGKSDLTAPILNFKQNRLVALFTLRLVRSILARFPAGFESQSSVSVRDKLVELSSLIPVLKHFVEAKEEPSQVLFVCELTRVVLEYKRAFPGSFVECKFDWLKLLDSTHSAHVEKIVIRFVFDLFSQSVPITQNVARMFAKLFTLKHHATTVTGCVVEYFSNGSGRLFADANFESLSFPELETSVTGILRTAMTDPHKLTANSVTAGKKRKTVEPEEKPEKKRKNSVVKSASAAVPRLALKNRWKCPPLPEDIEVDPFDLPTAGWVTMVFANALESSEAPAVNVIDLIGSNKLYCAIVSLSSADECVRASAFEVLAIALRALAMCIQSKGFESSRFAFREAPQVAMVLTWLRNGIPAPTEEQSLPAPIPLITSVFAVEAIRILFDPKHDLYSSVYKFVLARPGANIASDVQMWTELFFATDAVVLPAARAWMLDIVRTAASDRTSLDVMIRRGVVEAVIEATVNLNGTANEFQTGVEIVATMLKTVKDDEAGGAAFVRRYALCQWIQFVSNSKFVKFDDTF